MGRTGTKKNLSPSFWITPRRPAPRHGSWSSNRLRIGIKISYVSATIFKN